jgi:hypothetical protein
VGEPIALGFEPQVKGRASKIQRAHGSTLAAARGVLRSVFHKVSLRRPVTSFVRSILVSPVTTRHLAEVLSRFSEKFSIFFSPVPFTHAERSRAV